MSRAVRHNEMAGGRFPPAASDLLAVVCTQDRPLGPNQVLVGQVACLGHDGGGHTSWHCRAACQHALQPLPLEHHLDVDRLPFAQLKQLFWWSPYRD
jgi:hypothetical protein